MNIIVGLIIFVIVVFLLFTHVRVVPQAEEYVIESWGKYSGTWKSGLNLLLPLVGKIRKKVSTKEKVLDFKPQQVITKDNVSIQIDSVVFYQITDAKLFTYGIERPEIAIENLTATTLRNIVGSLDLEATLTSRDTINSQIRVILDEATDPWGIKVNRVELKNIDPPSEIKVAMERQMKADREKRESILRAEGQKQSAILVAEGEKRAAILRAEAEMESEILRAEGLRQVAIKEAQGQAEAIKSIKEAGADDKILALKGLEAFEKMADGKATKIIVPADLQNIASMTTIFGTLLKDDKETKK